ncbi:MAG: amidophosphoribosyltransferase [Bacteroidales bacterium]|nr:amidophosphoribosyltransferase [Bacteroidales bacterium]
MSDQIKHECGIALIRLRKPVEFYRSKYGTSFYGINKLNLLMEKQHNRGQDGAGAACIKLDTKPGTQYIDRVRSNDTNPIKDVFNRIYTQYKDIQDKNPDLLNDVSWLKENAAFTGELFLGHLRYGTFGGHHIENLHPVMRHNNWKSKTLVVAGNFNMTNVDELFERLVDLGQHPIRTTDTITVLEKIGHFLDRQNEFLYRKYKSEGYSKKEISEHIAGELEIDRILKEAAKRWDGGYAIGGMLGHGDAFIMRDPAGIRPAYYYIDDEVVVAASERPVIQTTFNVSADKIIELKPGHALIIKKDGSYSLKEYRTPVEKKSCSFERIYFSRGTDIEIYQERKKLGALLTQALLENIDYDLEHTVFSFIPNTAQVAFYGLVQEVDNFCNEIKKDKILQMGTDITAEKLDKIFRLKARVENVAVKDAKLRTFITQDNQRDDLVAHVYDITYGSIEPGVDTLVVIDDSIVRGTTLRQSILKILDRLEPKRIIIASSAPQIRYPDCYGIDMAKLNDFIAFNAAIELLKDTGQEHIINEVYNKCKAQEHLNRDEVVNYVTGIYEPFTAEQVSKKITQLLTPEDINAEVEIIYQTVENLHQACPGSKGDWYFTGNYPTSGGNKVVNKSFINYIEGKNERAY